MNCSQYIIAQAQGRAGCQVHLVANLIGSYRNAAENYQLATKKGKKAIAARSLAIFNQTQNALERIGRGEIVNRNDLTGVLL